MLLHQNISAASASSPNQVLVPPRYLQQTSICTYNLPHWVRAEVRILHVKLPTFGYIRTQNIFIPQNENLKPHSQTLKPYSPYKSTNAHAKTGRKNSITILNCDFRNLKWNYTVGLLLHLIWRIFVEPTLHYNYVIMTRASEARTVGKIYVADIPCLACLSTPCLSSRRHASRAHCTTASFFLPCTDTSALKGWPVGVSTGNL